MAKTCAEVATGLTEGLTDIVKKHFNAELLARWDHYYYGGVVDLEKMKATVTVTPIAPSTDGAGNIRISVLLDGHNVLCFTMVRYPACCAMVQCNHFAYSANVMNKKMVHAVMDHLMHKLRVYWDSNLRRIVFNFVANQHYRHHKHGYAEFGDTNLLPEQTDLRDMSYAWLYEWAISKRHQQLLTVNHNTNRIIHFVDCMWELPK